MHASISHHISLLSSGPEKEPSAATASACDSVTLQLATRTAAVQQGSAEEIEEHISDLLQSSLTTHLVEQLELLSANQGSAATAEGARTHAAAAVSALQLHSQILLYAAAVVTRFEGMHAGETQHMPAMHRSNLL